MSFGMILVLLSLICALVEYATLQSLKRRFHSKRELLFKLAVTTISNIAWKILLLFLAFKLVMAALV